MQQLLPHTLNKDPGVSVCIGGGMYIVTCRHGVCTRYSHISDGVCTACLLWLVELTTLSKSVMPMCMCPTLVLYTGSLLPAERGTLTLLQSLSSWTTSLKDSWAHRLSGSNRAWLGISELGCHQLPPPDNDMVHIHSIYHRSMLSYLERGGTAITT